MPTGYQTFEIELFDFRKAGKDSDEGSFRVRTPNNPARGQTHDEATDRQVTPNLLKAIRRLDSPGVRNEDIVEVGTTLANLLFPSSIRELFFDSLNRVGKDGLLRISLRCEILALTKVPWEYAYIPLDWSSVSNDETGFLCLNRRVSFVRNEVRAELPRPQGPVGGPIRLVALLADVINDSAGYYPPLQLDLERGNLVKLQSEVRQLELDICPNGTLPSLENALAHGVHIFHFAGHGKFDGVGVGFGGEGSGSVVLTKADGTADPLPASILAMNLANRGVRLAFLGGCETGQVDGVNPWSGVAPSLIKQGIPAVVGMQRTISDTASIAFSHGFYRSLVAGNPIDTAMSDGRLAIFNAVKGLVGRPARDWGVPVLYLAPLAEAILFPRHETQSIERQDLLTYLNALINHLENPPASYLKGRAMGQVRQRVRVSRERLRYQPDQTKRQEAERWAGYYETDYEVRLENRERIYSHRAADNYCDPAEGGPTVVDWDEVRGTISRGVILGDPGFGKTWLLRHEGVRVAREQREALETAQQTTNDTVVPIFIRLDTFALELAKTDAVDAALQKALQREIGVELSDAFKTWLGEQLRGEKCLVLLDALDEVPEGRRDVLGDGLKRLATLTQGRILLTSRIVGYASVPFELEGERAELELVAFETEQVEGFVQGWFTDSPSRGETLLAFFRQEPIVRAQARIPLLLSFICLIAEDTKDPDSPITIPIRRGELYEKVLHSLLAGKWRPEHRRERNELRIGAKLRLLEKIAWHFATAKGMWRDLLPLDEITDVILDAKETQFLQQKEGAPNALVELSEDDGVLVKAGATDIANSLVPYMFLHRTLHEYLVAHHLSRLSKDDYLTYIRPHLWFDADWEEAIVLLAGCLTDPDPLLQVILEEPDDAFHAMLFLAGRCLGEATTERRTPRHASTIINKLAEILRSSSSLDFSSSVRTIRYIGDHPAISLLIERLNDGDRDIRRTVARVLGEIKDPRSVPMLIEKLGHGNLDICWEVADALGEIKDPRSVPALIEKLGTDNVDIRWAVARVLGEIRDPRSVPALIERLGDDDPNVRWEVAIALGEIKDPRSVPALIERLGDGNPNVRWAVVIALGQIKDPRSVPMLIEKLGDADRGIRWAVIEALGEIKDPRSVPMLIGKLSDNARSIHWSVASALGEIKDPRSVPALIEKLGDGDPNVRKAVADALGEIKDPRSVPALIEKLGDGNPNVRAGLAKIIVTFGLNGEPELISAHVLETWATWKDYTSAEGLYDILVNLGPHLRHAVGPQWPAWRRRLMAPTLQVLARGLAWGPDREGLAETAYRSALGCDPKALPTLLGLAGLLWRLGRSQDIPALRDQAARAWELK